MNFDPRSLHKYVYAACDPTTCLDPTGACTLVEILCTTFIQVLLRVREIGVWVLKRVIEKQVQVLFGAFSGFIFGYMSGLAAEISGAHANPLVFGLVGAIGGIVAGFLSPLKWKASALLGFAIGLAGSLANDLATEGKIDWTKALLSGIGGAVVASFGTALENLLLYEGGPTLFGYPVYNSSGIVTKFVSAKPLEAALEVNLGALLADVEGALMTYVVEIIFKHSIAGEKVDTDTLIAKDDDQTEIKSAL